MQTTSPSSSASAGGTSLLLRLKENEAQAWTELVELYAPLIFHWCRVCKLESADAADIMQEVFSSASRGISTFKPSPNGSLRGWLWTITQNKIRDLCRRNDGAPPAAGETTLARNIFQLVFGSSLIWDIRKHGHQKRLFRLV